LEALQVLAEREISYDMCRGKLAEILEKVLKAELIRCGWFLEKTHDLERLPRLAAQRALLQDVALLIAVQLDELRLLTPVQAIGQNNQYIALHNRHLHRTSTRSRLAW
jgi:hypothetical protein